MKNIIISWNNETKMKHTIVCWESETKIKIQLSVENENNETLYGGNVLLVGISFCIGY